MCVCVCVCVCVCACVCACVCVCVCVQMDGVGKCRSQIVTYSLQFVVKQHAQGVENDIPS